MDIEIDSNFLPLPKEANFRSAVKIMMKTNQSMAKIKTEIFIKLNRRVMLILPLIRSDFRDARKITVKNSEITDENLCQIVEFVNEAEKMNLAKFGKQVITAAFEMEAVRNECREAPQIVEKALDEWFEKYLCLLEE